MIYQNVLEPKVKDELLHGNSYAILSDVYISVELKICSGKFP